MRYLLIALLLGGCQENVEPTDYSADIDALKRDIRMLQDDLDKQAELILSLAKGQISTEPALDARQLWLEISALHSKIDRVSGDLGSHERNGH